MGCRRDEEELVVNIRGWGMVVAVVGCGGEGDIRSGSGRGGRRARDVNERQIMRQTGDR